MDTGFKTTIIKAVLMGIMINSLMKRIIKKAQNVFPYNMDNHRVLNPSPTISVYRISANNTRLSEISFLYRTKAKIKPETSPLIVKPGK